MAIGRRIIAGRGLTIGVGLVLLGSGAARAAEVPADVAAEHAAFERQVEAELQAIAPEAVAWMQEAEQARDREDFAAADALYERILDRAPGFDHALRRKCAARSALGARIDAVSLCREALAARDSPENQMALARALTTGERIGDEGREEAMMLARQAAASEPDSVVTQMGALQIAMAVDAPPMMSAALARLRVLAPDDPLTRFFSAMEAGMKGELDLAEEELARARAAGVDPRMAEGLAAAIAEARPFWHRPLGWIKWGSLAWLAIAALLWIAGAALSRVTLATARRLPGAGEAHAGGRGLRRVYAAVLFASCVFYYVSLPLVILLVLALGGGIILGFMALGFLPIKLAAIVAFLCLGTMLVVLKNVFVRGKDADPGLRLDLAGEPRLRQLLDSVAAKIGTRPVDQVYLTPDTTIAVTERGGMLKQMRGAGERCLILGVGVLEGMTVGELSAILAHEYGHFSNRDTAGGGLALAVRRSLIHVAVGLAQGGSAGWWNPAWLFVNAFHRVFLRVSQGASRLQEVMADRWAARAYGPALFASGLRHVIRREIEFDARTHATLQEVIEGQRPLVNLYTYRPAQQPALDVEGLLQQALDAEPSPYDSHPRPADRIAWLAPIAAPAAAAGDEAESWSLFSAREPIERMMTALVRDNVAEAHGVRIAEAEAAG